jgi:hypothetical protein
VGSLRGLSMKTEVVSWSGFFKIRRTSCKQKSVCVTIVMILYFINGGNVRELVFWNDSKASLSSRD